MVSKRFARWIVMAVAAALFLGSAPIVAESKSGASVVDPALLADAKAHPNSQFQVIVRGAPAPTAFKKPVPTAKPGLAKPAPTDDNRDRVRKAEAVISALAPKGGDRRSLSIVGGASATLTGAQIVTLAKNPLVDRVVRNESFAMTWDSSSAAAASSEAAIQEVGAPAAWSQLGASGNGVGVAVIDSGVADHPDLGSRIIARVDLTGEQSNGDPGGHGTHVAGLIAGDGTASGGAWTGVAPRADIISVRVIDSTGTAKLSTIFAGMQWVLQNRSTYHIQVVNMSFGGTAMTGYQQDLLASAAELLYFAGLTVVVAAGNGGGPSTITSPATDPFVLTVGAADDNGTPTVADDTVATWSSRGPTAFDAIAKPDLIAPGRKIVGLRAAGSTIDTAYPDRRVTAPGAAEARYFTMSGTSMAAPIAAGVAALYLERNHGTSPLAVKQQLTGTAVPLLGVAAADQGAGMVNAFAALSAPALPRAYTPYPASTAFAEMVYSKLYGQPIVWRDLSFHGGVDANGIPWSAITWQDISWEDITWEDITWEAFTWTDISWEDITWEDISWETAK